MKTKKYLLAILQNVAVVALGVTNAFGLQQDKIIEEIEAQEARQQQRPSASLVSQPKLEYKASNLRDPFQGYEKEKKPQAAISEGTAAEGTLPAFTVQGLITGGDKFTAIINNKVVREGDTCDGAKILKIEKEGIDLLFAGIHYRLHSPTSDTLNNLQIIKTGERDEK
jgi:hypothetical protein